MTIFFLQQDLPSQAKNSVASALTWKQISNKWLRMCSLRVLCYNCILRAMHSLWWFNKNHGDCNNGENNSNDGRNGPFIIELSRTRWLSPKKAVLFIDCALQTQPNILHVDLLWTRKGVNYWMLALAYALAFRLPSLALSTMLFTWHYTRFLSDCVNNF